MRIAPLFNILILLFSLAAHSADPVVALNLFEPQVGLKNLADVSYSYKASIYKDLASNEVVSRLTSEYVKSSQAGKDLSLLLYLLVGPIVKDTKSEFFSNTVMKTYELGLKGYSRYVRRVDLSAQLEASAESRREAILGLINNTPKTEDGDVIALSLVGYILNSARNLVIDLELRNILEQLTVDVGVTAASPKYLNEFLGKNRSKLNDLKKDLVKHQRLRGLVESLTLALIYLE